MSAGIKKLGKDKRALTLDLDYTLSANDGKSTEYSKTTFASSGKEDIRDLIYDKDGSYSDIGGSLKYVEPFGKNWALSATLSSRYSVRKSTSDASNADGSANDYYSSVSDNYYFSNEGQLLAQFNKGKTNVQFGGQARLYKNENYARSFGLDTKNRSGRVADNAFAFREREIFRQEQQCVFQTVQQNGQAFFRQHRADIQHCQSDKDHGRKHLP